MSPDPPQYARYLLAIAAALSFLAIYVGQQDPKLGFYLIGAVGAINSFSAYLGWAPPVPSPPTPP